MVFIGQPILKKRFVMKGSAKGTSIASKYLSRTLPQRMPFRFLGTKVLGRMLGRAVPYIGTALIIIDVIELLIETYELEKDDKSGQNRIIFKGGHFGGGGASGRY